MENLNQTYRARLQFPTGWFHGIFESSFQTFRSYHSFPFVVLLYGQMPGKRGKIEHTRIRQIRPNMSCVLCVTWRLQIHCFLYFVIDLALAVQTDKPRPACSTTSCRQATTTHVLIKALWLDGQCELCSSLTEKWDPAIQAVETAVAAVVSFYGAAKSVSPEKGVNGG